MKKIFVLMIVMLGFACSSEPDQSPREINWDRDVCAQCLMGLADQKYSVQAINKYEDVIWFDDIGCLVEYMKGDDWKRFNGETAKIWIGDCETGEWIDATKAWYRFGDTTPMGYGYGALKEKRDSTYDFQTMTKRIEEGKTMREDFIKKHKMMDKK